MKASIGTTRLVGRLRDIDRDLGIGGFFTFGTAAAFSCLHREFQGYVRQNDRTANRRIAGCLVDIWSEYLAELLYHTESLESIRMCCGGADIGQWGKDLASELGYSRAMNGLVKDWLKEPSDLAASDLRLLRDARREIASALGVEVQSLEEYLHRGKKYWTRPILKAFLSGLLLREYVVRTSDALPEDADKRALKFYTYRSGDERYFDGLLQVFPPQAPVLWAPENLGHAPNPREVTREQAPPELLLAKFASLATSGADIIDRAARRFLASYADGRLSVLVFVPFFPDEDSQQAVQYWGERLERRLVVVYLNAFYEMFSIARPEIMAQYLVQLVFG